MNLLKKHLKLILIVLGVLILAIVGLFYFFMSSGIEDEAQPVVMQLPAETQNVTSSLDLVQLESKNWKEYILIKGWAFRDGVTSEKRDVKVVLKSPAETLVFTVPNDSVRRPDVTNYYHLDSTVMNLGVTLRIPVKDLNDTEYQVGFIVEDEAGSHFMYGSKALSLAGGNVEIKKLAAGAVKPKSNEVFLKMRQPTRKAKFGFDEVKVEGDLLTVIGWGFIQEVSTDDMNTYIILRKDQNIRLFSAKKRVRKDVAEVYKGMKVNLDSCGFITKIYTGGIPKGRYQLAVYMEKGDQTGIIYPDKYVDLDK